jgi:hypothetical protein
MSQDVASETKGLRREKPQDRPSITGGLDSVATTEQTVYRGRRDPTAPVDEEVEVMADGESLDCRYDLLSASPSGFEWSYGGSGPAQLAIAILADAYDDEFACEYYQQFKREVVSELPEEGWTLTKQDLDACRLEVIGDA